MIPQKTSLGTSYCWSLLCALIQWRHKSVMTQVPNNWTVVGFWFVFPQLVLIRTKQHQTFAWLDLCGRYIPLKNRSDVESVWTSSCGYRGRNIRKYQTLAATLIQRPFLYIDLIQLLLKEQAYLATGGNMLDYGGARVGPAFARDLRSVTEFNKIVKKNRPPQSGYPPPSIRTCIGSRFRR